MTEQIIAQRLGIALRQVQGTVRLLRDGATIPFISRYRKEATGSLDDQVLRSLYERLTLLLHRDSNSRHIFRPQFLYYI